MESEERNVEHLANMVLHACIENTCHGRKELTTEPLQRGGCKQALSKNHR